MRANEFVTEEPRVAAHRPEILSATDDGKTITIKVRTHDGSVRVLANSNPAVLQQQLNFKYGLRLPHSIARKFVGMPAAMAEDQADNPDSWESQAADAERNAETVRMADQDAAAGGLAEQDIDEDLRRRGFLQGLAAAVAGAATGNAFAGSSDPGFIRQVQDQHYSMIEKNPRYAKEHQALQLPVARGIAGSSAETNKRWAEKTAELLEKYGVKVNEGMVEGISLDALAKVGNLIPSFAQKLGIAAKQEAQETRDMLNILKLKMQGKPVTPEQIKFMNKQWKDLAIIALGVGTIGYATAAAGAAHGAAAAVSHGAKDALIHGIADIGLEAAAEVLAAKFGINIVKNLAHGLATSTGQGYEHGQEHAPAQYGVSPAVAAQNQANLEKKFQQAKMGFGGMSENQLDEKSTSQAQFRTMAAAAHNPKFAKKVGINPDVAQEFHGADKKSNYKSLPKKAAEDASWGMAPESRGYKK